MTPPPHDKGHKPPHDPAIARAYNTAEHAMRAVETSRSCIGTLKPGKVWTHRGKHNEFEIKGCLELNNQPVAMFRFNPADGSLMPKGLHALSAGTKETLIVVQNRLTHIPQEITVLEGAEFREPEFCWAVPLAVQGRIVGHLKVSADGTSVLPDKKAMEEIAALG
jgi:hypothetical protein